MLTPLSVDPAHPFPYISNLSLNLAAMVRDPMTGVRRFARVKVPPLLPRFVPLPDGERFVPLETVIAAHLGRLFPGMELVAYHTFRLTRDADLEVEEDEAEDLLEAIQSVLRRRRRGANPVRLEVDETMSHEVLELLRRELDLEEQEVVVTPGLLDLSALWSLVSLDRPELKHEPWVPVTQPRLTNGEAAPDLFQVLRAGDVLVHHPYDSFSSSVEAFVEQAARDPAVLAIKQTMYRTSTQESPIIRALIRAAELGKQVVALVELKARFDEEANITYARELEQAGVHVVHGVVGLKTHAKISLVVRREAGGVRRYAHVGTGNYNPVTARLYEDIGLLTADPEIGADLTDLFNLLTGYSRQREYRRLLVAPEYLRPEMLELIRGQAREGGRIVLKMNALVDPDMVDALYEASQAGAEIDLIVRGICCLRPGIPGLSERIAVRSLVGRYLEHSRIFRFGERAEATHYIGSADLMQRNLDRRVEALVPVADPSLAGEARRDPRRPDAGRHALVDARRGRNLDQGARRARHRRAAASPGAGGRARGVAGGVSKTAASTNLERETKLEAPAGFRIPELGGDGLVATEVEPQRLVTVYVDTPDLRIVRWGSSLRHRAGRRMDRQAPVVGQRVAARPHRGQLRGRRREEAADGGRRSGSRLRPRRGARAPSLGCGPSVAASGSPTRRGPRWRW